MKIDIKNKTLIFVFDFEAEEMFMYNAIAFAVKILQEQKGKAKTVSKEINKKIKRIISENERGQLLEKVDKLKYISNVESIQILFDNAIFIIRQLKEDIEKSKEAKHNMLESYDLIENALVEIVDYIKEKETKS